jgi:hypothetical protein
LFVSSGYGDLDGLDLAGVAFEVERPRPVAKSRRPRCWPPELEWCWAFAAAATRALARDIAAFTGQDELGELTSPIGGVAAGGSVVRIHAISGTTGKTPFAVHAARRPALGFPDGQFFFLPLHADTTGPQPVGPADALASLLLAAGFPRR